MCTNNFFYQNWESYIWEFLHNFTEKWGILCPISENKKSSGRDLKCHKSKSGCNTKFLEIPGSGAKVSPEFECLYGCTESFPIFSQIPISPKYIPFFLFFEHKQR